MTKTLLHGEDMPMKNNDLNNLLSVAKDAVVDIPEDWKENKPCYVVIPNDGSGAQVHEFKQRPVDVLIQKDLNHEVASHCIETFINALPRPLCPMIGMLQLTETSKGSTEWTLDVILSTDTNYLGKWVILPKVAMPIPSETLEVLHGFITKLAEDTGPLKNEVTEDECSMTLVYKEAPIMAGWYRPKFNFKI